MSRLVVGAIVLWISVALIGGFLDGVFDTPITIGAVFQLLTLNFSFFKGWEIVKWLAFGPIMAVAILGMALQIMRFIVDDVIPLVPERVTIREYATSLSRQYEEYINNMDGILGIQTVNSRGTGGLVLTTDRKLMIDTGYDWYIVSRHKESGDFKVVGFPKEGDKKIEYVLGRNGLKEVQYTDDNWSKW